VADRRIVAQQVGVLLLDQYVESARAESARRRA
jgi:hypothetical protein